MKIFEIWKKKSYLCFIDLKKAFNRVLREKIWENLELYGIDISLIERIKSLYKGSANIVITVNKESEGYIKYQGVRQWRDLSPVHHLHQWKY